MIGSQQNIILNTFKRALVQAPCFRVADADAEIEMPNADQHAARRLADREGKGRGGRHGCAEVVENVWDEAVGCKRRTKAEATTSLKR